ncbi:macoilin-like [Acanthaster planci]|uniref:Macoilin n=1 Tax=Acanthaster planci TaxID=133434 RepID=A0A8B7YND4_ACAPL|nr:macoilin-like [Acanthaster planci]
MKRRNVDYGKLRRPLKRNKIAEGIYGSTFLYLKFLAIWMFVLLLDFILEFRFEYLWPLWLLLRSIYDSYRYQGLAFSVVFIFIAFTSDMICLLFIPVHWLFFVASTYVWVEFVSHTDRGICLPTVSLWLLFVYIEASVRLRELRSAIPFHLDLCRPFAAHCIGYPVVTLGFNFKTYVGYRMRLRKQKEVQKENDFYIQLLQQALPPEQQQHHQLQNTSLTTEKQKAITSKAEEPSSNGVVARKGSPVIQGNKGSSDGGDKAKEPPPSRKQATSNNATVGTAKAPADPELIETKLPQRSVNDYDGSKENLANEQVQAKNLRQNASGGGSGGSGGGGSQRSKNPPSGKQDNSGSSLPHPGGGGKKPKPLASKLENKEKEKDTNLSADIANGAVPAPPAKDEKVLRLESDIKRLKADLQASRQVQADLRAQVSNLLSDDQHDKAELEQMKKDYESLQTKLHNLVTQKQQDKQNIARLEQQLKTERESRSSLEAQIREERKTRKAKEAAAARAAAMATAGRYGECGDSCRMRMLDQDSEILRLRKESRDKDDHLREMEKKTELLQERQETQNKTDLLMSALMAMQDRTAKLETSLSAETRLKLDLFSALGDARRQMEILQTQLMKKEREIHDLKTKIAEVMAVMPPSNYSSAGSPISGTPRYSVNFVSSEESGPTLPISSLAHGGTGGDARAIPVSQSVPPGVALGVAPGAAPTGASASSTPVSVPQGSSSSQSPSPSVSPVPSVGNGKSVLDPNAAVYRPKSN